VKALGKKVEKAVAQFKKETGKDFELWFEPGKYLVSKSGHFLVKSNVIKQTTATVFVGGPLEIIDDEKTGLLFESMNSDSLCEKLSLIIQNKELKETLALNGKIKANEFFDSKKQFEEIKELLNKDI
jgi:hypothetical protein